MEQYKKLLLCLLLPFTSAMAGTGYSIKMKLTGFKDGTEFKLVNLALDKVVDSGKLENGHLMMKGYVQVLTTFRIHTVDNKYLVLYLENKPITITGDYRDFYYAKVEGSETNTYWTRSRDAQKNYQQTRDSLVTRYLSLAQNDSLQGRKIGLKMMQMDSLNTISRKAFINAEKPNYFTLNELFYLRNDFTKEELSAVFKKFPAALQNTRDGNIIKAYITTMVPIIGAHYTDIDGIDAAGVKHKLSDLNGSYTLLEFWASWCGPCRQENILTLKTYQQYHDKGFQIFGFSIDADRDSWITAIKEDQLSWLNVSDLMGSYSISAATYQVRAIPQNFLIDSKGIIIAKNLRGQRLVDFLASVYNNH